MLYLIMLSYCDFGVRRKVWLEFSLVIFKWSDMFQCYSFTPGAEQVLFSVNELTNILMNYNTTKYTIFNFWCLSKNQNRHTG